MGDYQIKFGQGVSLWSGTGNKKSAFTTQNARKQKGVKAYKSTDENKFFRGTAITLSPLKNLTMVGFASLKKLMQVQATIPFHLLLRVLLTQAYIETEMN